MNNDAVTQNKRLSNEKLTDTVTVLKALADPTRLKIVTMLKLGETCSCEFTEQLNVPANLLSHHLRSLKKAGLISGRRDSLDGRWIYYRLNEEALGQWQQFFAKLLDPASVGERKNLCGPEGQTVLINPAEIVLNA